jgi:hypothetical protein
LVGSGVGVIVPVASGGSVGVGVGDRGIAVGVDVGDGGIAVGVTVVSGTAGPSSSGSSGVVGFSPPPVVTGNQKKLVDDFGCGLLKSLPGARSVTAAIRRVARISAIVLCILVLLSYSNEWKQLSFLSLVDACERKQ